MEIDRKGLLQELSAELLLQISNPLPLKDLESLKEGMKNKTIYTGKVLLTSFDILFDRPTLLVDFNGLKAIILQEDVDYQRKFKSLASFVATDISFVISEIDEDNGVVFLSRKEAQLFLFEVVKEELESGAEMEGEITGLLDYAAYVSLRGGVYTLLRNSDFSDAYLRVSDHLAVGDKIMVKLKSISGTGKISVEPVEKIEVDSLLNFEMLEEGQVVEATVKSIRTFGTYVFLVPGVDGLCNVPSFGEIREGSRVAFKITKKHYDDDGMGKIRGSIVKIVSY